MLEQICTVTKIKTNTSQKLLAKNKIMYEVLASFPHDTPPMSMENSPGEFTAIPQVVKDPVAPPQVITPAKTPIKLTPARLNYTLQDTKQHPKVPPDISQMDALVNPQGAVSKSVSKPNHVMSNHATTVTLLRPKLME